ncbi:MAG TPA: hypothetical protein VMF06_11275 [Candidatus Limnocylindria bacterium]|jgi:hypothetical protein|nr:hypothetical protein [Candidatus Limnocylindria bacterium]
MVRSKYNPAESAALLGFESKLWLAADKLLHSTEASASFQKAA